MKIHVKPIINKRNGQYNFYLKKKQLTKKLISGIKANKILEIRDLKII